MVFCSNCGVQNDEGSRFCANCGFKIEDSQPIFASNAQKQPTNQYRPQTRQYVDSGNYGYQDNLYRNNPPQTNQPQYGNQPQSPYNNPPSGYGYQPYGQMMVEDRVNPFLYVLALIFPIGLLLYFANRRERPNSARNLLIAAFIGFVLFLF